MDRRSRFSDAVAKQLKFYVYRLIDPRNGETFYVGKGTRNRVFAHAHNALGNDGDVDDDKLKRIKEIILDGFDVTHVIHRHGMEEKTAFDVEAALIDAYPEAINPISGHESDEFGLMHARQIIERYEAEEAVFRHKAILININRTATEADSIYDAVRYAWKINAKRAGQAEVVLAVDHGLIVGAFVPDKWLDATVQNFPGKPTDREGRRGFVGHEAPEEMAKIYLRRRVPASMQKKGARSPIRYATPTV